ncbi:aminopeptidase P family protein [Enterovibrio paralichthyis]|uniref:aminopeptidase P family protein n=1 Tax=Enterovibrio paralichthyis TaxID=2853805 RepID=UPI001C48E46E|nr:aminopeptidase P family protein [Enterovibrio paralichthyis]MBV7300448.1 aminopeptidase P family protein [Enterovibrio paralichthyis]
MHAIIAERVDALRRWLEEQAMDALIIPHEDEFLGEYIPEHNERLHWATGFTGSAGAAVITREKAAVFVDGRYTVQVRKQVPGEIFEYRHLIEEPALQWLLDTLPQGSKVAVDTRLHSANWLAAAEKTVSGKLILQSIDRNPIDTLWHDRPVPLLTSARLMGNELVGKGSTEKRTEIGAVIAKTGADAALLSQLDSICWLLNIRGGDVSRLPVLLASALINASGDVTLFIDPARLPEGFAAHVGEGVSVLAPEALASELAALSAKTVMVDPQTSNAWASEILKQHGAKIVHAADPCMLPKAAKNAVEIAGMKASHVRDGVAVSRFLAWLDKEVAAGKLHDEALLADKLYSFRAEDETLADLSFDTISAAGGNAAMCHYNHQNQPEPGQLELNNVYLVDSGGQYPDGTTDITRTIAIGECSDEVKKAFTLVLKGHIALATARFPKGTAGSQLDALARQHLWAHGFDYDHGTGHGVGHFLSVHEEPQRIAKAPNTVALLPGMVLSNEPGYYRADAFGIRIENLELVVEVPTQGDMTVLGFESLTRAPIDRRLVDVSLLTDSEIAWWNDYHRKVWQDVSPSLQGCDLAWLEQATKAL